MAEELRDFRGKLTTRADAVLSALSHVTGRDKAEIVREVLDKWAADEIHKATVIARLANGEGGVRE